MSEDQVRLGGMALQNGVLVHGPTSWGCAVRDANGVVRVASSRKPVVAAHARRRYPILRGPLVLADALAVLPAVRRALPEARLPFERPAVLGAIAATVLGARSLRRSHPSVVRELAAAALGVLPALVALRGPDLAAYHGAEHVSIGTYEAGGIRAPKEHPRCGTQLVAPLVATTVLANVATAALPPKARGVGRVAGVTIALGVAVELHAWAARHPEHVLASVVTRPGYELQRRFSTAEPSAAQLEVADAARDACLQLELGTT